MLPLGSGHRGSEVTEWGIRHEKQTRFTVFGEGTHENKKKAGINKFKTKKEREK